MVFFFLRCLTLLSRCNTVSEQINFTQCIDVQGNTNSDEKGATLFACTVQVNMRSRSAPRYISSKKIVGNLLHCCLSKCVAASMKYLNLWLLIFAFTCCKGLNKILLLLQIKSMRILELPYRKTWPPLPLVSMCRLSGSPSQRSQKSSGRTTKPCKQLTMHILYKQGEKNHPSTISIWKKRNNSCISFVSIAINVYQKWWVLNLVINFRKKSCWKSNQSKFFQVFHKRYTRNEQLCRSDELIKLII